MNRFIRASPAAPVGGWALGLAMATNGVMTGTWVTRLPAVSERMAVTDGTLGVALLGSAIGALLSLFVAGHACRTFGVRRVYTFAVTIWALLYALAVLSPSPLALFATLFVIGAMNGVFGVVINASAHELELRYARPLLPRYHGMFSVGALVGSLLGAKVAAHIGPIPHVIGISVLCTVSSFVAARNIPTAGVVHPEAARRRTRRLPFVERLAILRRPESIAILGIGLIAMCTTLAEGASNNWSAIFLHHDRGTSESLAAAGFAAYAGAMAIGRLGGNFAARRFSRPALLRFSGIMLFAGIVTLVSAHGIALVMAAMIAWGIGVALIFPTAMGAAAEVLHEPAAGISRVAMIGFVGFVIGPPTIGWLATTINLGAGLLVIAGVGLALIVLAPFAKHRVPVGDSAELDQDDPLASGELVAIGV